MEKKKRHRNLSDTEIGLIRAMLQRGLPNDEVHFYFNRADRLISSGRIAQIRNGQYGKHIPAAPASEVDGFIQAWNARNLLHERKEPPSPTDIITLLSLFTRNSDDWAVKTGESDSIEYKHSFRIQPIERFADAIKTIAGFANNKGGYLLFGVHDTKLNVTGLPSDEFRNTDSAAINRTLTSTLDPVPRVSKAVVTLGAKHVGVLYIERHENAPVIALKNIGNDLKEGAIYYRYMGETRSIKPAELRQIIATRIQRGVGEFARRMARVATGSNATLDLDSGKLEGPTGRLTIDRDLLERIQFVREGDFSELKGAPALRIVGEVEPISEVERERLRVIRANVTPDAIIRSFLSGERVSTPMQYIHAQAHQQRRWHPLWYYVHQASEDVEHIIAQLNAQVATHPASRRAVVERLLKRSTAHKLHTGKPTKLTEKMCAGEIEAPNNHAQDMYFSLAIQGLPNHFRQGEKCRSLLVDCLDRAQGDDTKSSQRRSAIYRAACRIDELLYSEYGN